MATELELAYDHCRRIAREKAKNFYYAFRTLPGPKRRAIYATYAFCRHCDDIADDDRPLEEKRRLFARERLLLGDLGNDGAGGPVYTALRDTSQIFGIPLHYFEEVIEGVEMDLTWTRFKTFETLRDYAYRVASVVGLICIEVFGYEDEKAKEYAIAIADYTSACNLNADMPHGFIGRGKCFAAMGHFDKAIADFECALVIAPENPELLQACAWALATAPQSDFRNSTRAVSVATKLCELRKRSWQAFDTLAAAQAEAGRFEKASEAVATAIELAPDAELPAIKDRAATYAAMKPYHQPATAKIPLLPEPPEAEDPTVDDTGDATVGTPKKVPEEPVP